MARYDGTGRSGRRLKPVNGAVREFGTHWGERVAGTPVVGFAN
jgi:hypothetical protein